MVSNPNLIKTYSASAAIAQYRLVALGSSDGEAVQASAATDRHIGVAMHDAASGERIEVVRSGIAEVELGGVVARGNALTADANGKAVAASASATVQALIAGGAAGAHTVTGILAGDELVSVYEQDGTSGLLTDRTSEFSITDDDEISNTGGTATTGDKLLVTWRRVVLVAGFAEVSGVSGDIVPMLVQMG